MITIIISTFVLVLLIAVGGYIYWQHEKGKKGENYIDKSYILDRIFEKNGFMQDKVLQVNKDTVIAINKKGTKFALLQNLNYQNEAEYVYNVGLVSKIQGIKCHKNNLEIEYYFGTETKKLSFKTTNKDVKKFVHELYKKTCISKIKEKFPNMEFNLISACNWECDYLWAYSNSGYFVYFDSEKHFVSNRIDLLETNLTLDTKYSYLEMSIYGINQQLLVYSEEFYDELYKSLIAIIKEKYAMVIEDTLYYDNNQDVAYLSNGENSLQIVNLGLVEEVYYFENKISFKTVNNDKLLNYMAPKEYVDRFEEFVVSLNIRKIATSFDYTSDKLINTSENTKLIIDFSRSRIVYCANLNSFAKFGYYIVGFDSIKNVEYIKGNQMPFVRIYTQSGDIIDVSCKKREVAEYIMAQIKVILKER